jgi:hypothetical protein
LLHKNRERYLLSSYHPACRLANDRIMELIHLLWRFEDGERVKRAALHFHVYYFLRAAGSQNKLTAFYPFQLEAT